MISIVIQGITNNCDSIIKNVSGIKEEIIWSTWRDEPEQNLEKICKAGIKLVFDQKPENYGYGNLNLQTRSTINGLKQCSEEYALKIRSDIIISDYESFLNLLYEQRQKLNFLCWHDVEKKYPVDYISFGNINEMKEFWDLCSERYDTFAERQLIENFCFKKKFDIEDCLLNKFNYFLDKINNKDIILFWIKNNIFINDYIKHEEFKY